MMLDEVRRRNARRVFMDEAIDELVDQAVKRLQADHDALMAEVADAEKAANTDRILEGPHCLICLEDSLDSVCARCEAKGGLYLEWRDTCG